MNFGIITSYVIAGMVLLSILMMNFSVSQSTGELTMARNLKTHVNSIADVISHDFSKIGYNWMGKINNPITTAESNKIVFASNIDNDASNDAEKVTWTFGNSEVSSTSNPNDYVLTRHIVQGSVTIDKTDITLGVTKFQLHYYDEVGSTTPLPTPVANPEDIRQIEIELIVQSGEKIYNNTSDGGRYMTSTWQKRFSPINLQE
ncbi:hypothetical protein ACG2F4_06210 [Halalkalibaculum sp. DA3122]|uniref:hypothetical protein n=1 Tax=unclassified Halalkalibaculum TaxID=2964617 RepID=UPI003754C990